MEKPEASLEVIMGKADSGVKPVFHSPGMFFRQNFPPCALSL